MAYNIRKNSNKIDLHMCVSLFYKIPTFIKLPPKNGYFVVVLFFCLILWPMMDDLWQNISFIFIKSSNNLQQK